LRSREVHLLKSPSLTVGLKQILFLVGLSVQEESPSLTVGLKLSILEEEQESVYQSPSLTVGLKPKATCKEK